MRIILQMFFFFISQHSVSAQYISQDLHTQQIISFLLALNLPLLKSKTLNNWRINNELDSTYYFIVFLISSTCFGHYYAHRQELATMMLITTLVVSFLICCMLEVRCGFVGVVSGLQAKACKTAPNLQHTANQERYGQFGNQHHTRKLLMMCTVVPETYWAHKKYNKIISCI